MANTLKDLIRDLAPQEAKEFGESISDAVITSLVLSILEEVPDEKLLELDAVIEANDPQALTAFLQKHVPSLEGRLAESLKRMREEAQILLS